MCGKLQVLYISPVLGFRELPVISETTGEFNNQLLALVRDFIEKGATFTVCYLDIDDTVFWEDIENGQRVSISEAVTLKNVTVLS